MQTSWLLGSSCLCFSKYLATSSGLCWSRNRMGHTAAEPDAATDAVADAGLLLHISARIGSVNEGRFDLRPRTLNRDVELRGVASGLPLPLPDAKGQASLLGVPATVKSFSIGDVALLVCISGNGAGLSADGPLHIFTLLLFSDACSLTAASSAFWMTSARLLRSTSSLFANCSTKFKCIRGCSSPTRSRSCRKVRWSCDNVLGVKRFKRSRYYLSSAVSIEVIVC